MPDAEGAPTCVIVGGGPAGVVLGLLLSRAGVPVHVLEKHDDFLRDFRGDTVHPTTQALLDQLGLLPRFGRIVRGRVHQIEIAGPDGPVLRVPLRRAALGSRFRDIALAPQWDLLSLLVEEAERSPHFRMSMSAEVVDVVRGPSGQVTGVTYRHGDETVEERAVLTVIAAGRRTALRQAADAPIVDLGSPMDVLWLRLPRQESDGSGLLGRIGSGDLAIAIDRGDYWQVAYVIPAGAETAIRSAGTAALRDRLRLLLPFPPTTFASLESMADVASLRVGLDRLTRWWAPGLLLIGDAAHTMSPVGGVGINLAVQDAVAAANELIPRLLEAQRDPRRFERTLGTAPLTRIQRRRLLAARVTQALQKQVHRRIIQTALDSGGPRIPWFIAADLRHGGLLARLIVRMLVWGVRPERLHVGRTLRRPPDLSSRGRRRSEAAAPRAPRR